MSDLNSDLIRADYSTDSSADSSRFQLGFRAGFRASVDDRAYAALSAHCPVAYIISIYVSITAYFYRFLRECPPLLVHCMQESTFLLEISNQKFELKANSTY